MNNNIGFGERLRWRLKTVHHKIQQYRLTTNETIVADTEYGKVKGVKRISLYDVPYYSFEGIPYAQPPVGELRFRAPQRPTPWEGTKDCSQCKDKAIQVQFVYDKVEGSEDCLYLNVYTNNVTPTKPRPVMVWIHGGAFIQGEGNREWYGPDYFIEKDVVLVVIQYRLGVLGFLSLNSPELNVPGNAALKDQVMALKWVKNNCANFGGDPNCITVFGESAGGVATHYMMITEQTKGLFHRAILQSGAVSWAGGFNGDITHNAYRIAKVAGYKGENNDKDVLDFLLKADAKDLIRLEGNVITPEEHLNKILFAFGPSLEPYVTPESVIPKLPIELIRTAWSSSMPVMIGNTSYEGLLWLPETKMLPQVVEQVEIGSPFLPRELLATNPSIDKKAEWSRRIRDAHRTSEVATIDNYMELCSMYYFIFPAIRMIRSHLAHDTEAPVYLYRYDFDSEQLIFNYRIMREGRGVKGVGHADELGYLFSSLQAHRLPKQSRDYRNIERLIGIWTQFATTGNPNSTNINGMDTLTWDPVQKTDKVFKCLNISDDLKYIELPEWNKVQVWESLYENNKDLLINLGFMERLRWRLKTIEHKIQQYRLTTNETIVADTEYGKVQGVKKISLYDVPYYSFEGIPYAQPPVGELRFRAPQRPTPWEGIRDCSQYKDKAIQVQFVYDKVEGSEDCLYLNVFTNNVTPTKPRPVMVWIHGGGFIQGEGNREWYGPDYFIKEDVVLVTISYRLGALGFLSLSSPELNVPGNAGLKDQVMALKWIKNNCANFGGDPNCITVFGESAGGASTHYMMITDQTQGLFHRAVLQSGSAICPWAYNGDITHNAFRIAKLAGYKGENNDKDVLSFLHNIKAKDLIRVEENVLSLEDRNNNIMFAFGPSLEPFVTPECVVPKHPRELMKTAWSNSIPIMIGNTSYEGLLWVPLLKMAPQVTHKVDVGSPLIPQELLATDPSSDKKDEWSRRIRDTHRTGEVATADNYMDYCSLFYFVFPAIRVIKSRQAYAAGAPVYFYRYDFDSEEIIFNYRIMRLGRGVKGVSHADELAYQFSSLQARRLPKESREYRNIERTVGIWTQFATTGNPYNEKINGMDTLTWDPVRKTDEVFKCLNISDDLRYIDLPEWSKVQAWESLYENNKDLLF
ncbi:uncharacterized protein alpha-Est7 [Drosophila tropicalis]|uniref:uncharacterized protein alpha-Est7 n=1 Tax=Drosophila tropicalis TaxID=46794 RepID=UPI0035ABDE94